MSSGNALSDALSGVAVTNPLTGVVKLATDPVGKIVKIATAPVTGLVKAAGGGVASAGLHAIGSWVLDGTKAALQEVAGVIGTATAPNLQSTWFSPIYWRVAALATLLTVPFLCAAAVQAVARADLALLVKSAFGYLPLALVTITFAAPLTMLLLSATDQMSAIVSAGAVDNGSNFLDKTAVAVGAASVLNGSPFLAVIVGLFTIMAALALATELLIREAAVYVVVMLLPLAFAAMVWPARRIWAVRIVELLISLILSKFVIVAVLTLAAAPFANGDGTTISQVLTAMSLVMLATFSPWALMRLLPFTELAAGAAGMLRRESQGAALSAGSQVVDGSAWVMGVAERMRAQAGQTSFGAGSYTDAEPGSSSAFSSVSAGSDSSSAGSGSTSAASGSSAKDPDRADSDPTPAGSSSANPGPVPAGSSPTSGSGPNTSATADTASGVAASTESAARSRPGAGSLSETSAGSAPAGGIASEGGAAPAPDAGPGEASASGLAPVGAGEPTGTPGSAPADNAPSAYVPPEFMRGSEPLTLGPEFVNGQPPADPPANLPSGPPATQPSDPPASQPPASPTDRSPGQSGNSPADSDDPRAGEPA